MPSLELDFEVFCANCGDGLCGNCLEGKTGRRGLPFIKVEPCEKCQKRAEDDGYEKGYEAAKKEAP